ncbi:MAG: CvpA family protein [Desulfobulbaceae bacterium]|nr:CvpA family protein [Desulfobulbaceae bacterium]
MSILDIIILIVIALFLARGLWAGFVKQIAGLAALIIGFVVAGRFYGQSSSLDIPFIQNPQVGFFASYILIFLVTFFSVICLGMLLKKVVQLSLLGWFDRLLGGILGLAKGSFVSCLLFMGLALFISAANPFFNKSFFYPYLEKSSAFIISVVKDENLRKGLLPQKPAISSFLPQTVKLGKKIGVKAEEKP